MFKRDRAQLRTATGVSPSPRQRSAGRGSGNTAVELRKFPRKRRRLLPLLPQGRRGLGRGGPNEFSCRRTPRVKTDSSPQPSPRSAGRGRSHAALPFWLNSTAVHPSPLPVRRGEGEATAPFLAFPN